MPRSSSTTAGRDPGFLDRRHPEELRSELPPAQRDPRAAAAPRLPLASAGGTALRRTPFVIEGDEYDTAFFEKTAEVLHYRPEVAIVTSIEHDHVDIYPDEASYHAAFRGFIERVPAQGLDRGGGERRGAWRARVATREGRGGVVRARRRRHPRQAAALAGGAGAPWTRAGRRSISTRAGCTRGASRHAHPRAPQRAQRGRGDRGGGAGLRGAARRADGARSRASRACGGGKICSSRRAACACTTTSRTTRRPSTRRSRALRAAPGGQALGGVRATQRDGVPGAPPGALRARVRRGGPGDLRAPGAAGDR